MTQFWSRETPHAPPPLIPYYTKHGPPISLGVKKEVPIKIWDSVVDMAKEIVLPNFISPPPPPSSYASNKNVLYQKLSAGLQTRHSKKRIELQLYCQYDKLSNISFRSKYMGVVGRLRFARKPICVIGKSKAIDIFGQIMLFIFCLLWKLLT